MGRGGSGTVSAASAVYALGIRVESEVVFSHEFSQNFVIGSDHPPSIQKVEIRHRSIPLQNFLLELSRGYIGPILQLMHGSIEGENRHLACSFHYKRL